MNMLLQSLSNLKRSGVILAHIAIFVIFAWIGGLKFFNYEAEGIVPFVANSPLSTTFYKDSEHYKTYKIPEGTFDEKNMNGIKKIELISSHMHLV